jgi:hypothetical protein
MMKLLKSFFTYSLIVVFSLLFGFFICEAYYRLALRSDQDNPFINFVDPIFYRPYPYSMFKGKPGATITEADIIGEKVLFNANGFRGPVPSSFRKPGELRIFIVGGSTILGSKD